GTFIKTARPPEVGTRCLFSLSLPALPEPLLLDGEVAWILAPADAEQRVAEPGMGVRFVFADEAARREFERAVERMMEESFGSQVAQRLIRRRSLGNVDEHGARARSHRMRRGFACPDLDHVPGRVPHR